MHGTACTGHIIILIGILPDNDKEIMTNNKMTGNKLSISAFLSIVGGVIMIAGGTSTIFMFDWYQSTFGEIHWMPMRYYMHQGTIPWSHSEAMSNIDILGSIIGLSLLSIGPGIVSLIVGYKMHKNPVNCQNWALLVFTASIIGFFGMGLFGIGAILGIIGGIIGVLPRRKIAE